MRFLAPAADVHTPTPASFLDARKPSTSAHPTTDERALTSSGGPRTVTVTSPTIPTVVLNTDVVSNNMAARLCISFLGHVLFLKNQVPFPIVQLARMHTSDILELLQRASRAAKKRQELLRSFETLSSHLYATFIALSTALALKGTPEKTESGTNTAPGGDRKCGVGSAFLAVALGPTVGTAKSRVIVGIDGLETNVWGLREDMVSDGATRRHEGEDGDDSSESAREEQSGNEEEEEEEEEERLGSREESVSESGSCETDGSPPPSRSPSPAASSDSSSPSTTSPNVASQSPLPRVEDPETVHAAERLLSRTLASACAEDDGQGLASEMAPTQTHVLLRAPRRFNHPSWIPRQNLCAPLDSCLSNFLEESGETPASRDPNSKKRTKVSRVQGIWVGCHGRSSQREGAEEQLAEEDELIWWSWDGKLVGFTDW